MFYRMSFLNELRLGRVAEHLHSLPIVIGKSGPQCIVMLAALTLFSVSQLMNDVLQKGLLYNGVPLSQLWKKNVYVL